MEISTIASGQAPCLSGSSFKPAGFLKPMFTGEVKFAARNSFRAARLKKTNKGHVKYYSSPRSDSKYNERKKKLMTAMKAKLEKKLKYMEEQSTLPSSQEGAEALPQQVEKVMTSSLAAAAADVQADNLAIDVDVSADDGIMHSDEEGEVNMELQFMLDILVEWLMNMRNNP